MYKSYCQATIFAERQWLLLPWNKIMISLRFKHRKLKTFLIWRSSKKTNRNKLKKLSKCFSVQVKFPMLFFQLYSTANHTFSFYVLLREINCITIQAISLVLNVSILAEILRVLLSLTSSFASDWKVSPNHLNFFSTRANKTKTCGLVQ